MSRLVSSVSLVLLSLLLVLPLLMIDGLILYVGDVSYDSFVGCLVFLVCFYLASLVVSVVFDGMMRALRGLFKRRFSNILFAVVNGSVSLSVFLDGPLRGVHYNLACDKSRARICTYAIVLSDSSIERLHC